MTITAPLIDKISSIEKENNIKENKLLILAMSLSIAKTTGFKKIKEHIFSEEEFNFFIDLLYKENLLTKTDINTIEKLQKIKIVSNKNHDKEIEEIIKDLGLITKTNSRVTDNKKKLIERWLKNGYEVKDFKLVNSYFYHIWNNPEMEKYIRETTLYNTKFPERVEEAKKATEKFDKYTQDLFDICKMFEAYFTEYVLYNTTVNQTLLTETTSYCKYLSFTAKKRISFWLEKYPKEKLIKTMIITIVSWSKKEEIREYISLEKIFDTKFEDRLKIAEIKEIPFVKEKKSTAILKEWYKEQLIEYDNETKEKIIEYKDEKEDIEHEQYIDAEVSEDGFMRTMFKKMKLW